MFRSSSVVIAPVAASSLLRSTPLSFRTVPAVYAIGLNFHSHAREVGLHSSDGNGSGASPTPASATGHVKENPVVIMKGPNSVITSSSASQRINILIPKFLQHKPEVDYEGELAVVISQRGKNIAPEHAHQYVSGITCAVDVTARRWQGKKGGGQWSFSKSFDTFCPIGPHLAHVDNLNDIKQLSLTTTLNGSVVQHANLSDMVTDVQHLISFLSQGTTLEAGTIILCGTPAGVGYRRDPPYYLRDGDTVDVSITGVGTLKTIIRNDSV